MAKFTPADIYAAVQQAAQEPIKPATADFTIKGAGRDWTFTIRTDGRKEAAQYYRLQSCLSRAMMECGKVKGMEKLATGGLRIEDPVLVPQPPHTLVIDEPNYLGQLYVLQAVLADPPELSPEELAALLHVIGDAPKVQELLDFACEQNGVNDYIKKLAEEAKNALGQAQ